MFLPEIRCREDIVRLVDELGFLPYFKGEIPGFSIEENCRRFWGTPEDPDCPWDWKGPVIRESGCAYGKYYRGRALYISRDWFPDFANYRRDGYDYDARADDGKARHRDARIMQILGERSPLVSKELKALACLSEDSRKSFDANLVFLQMQGYVTVSDFVYQTDRHGKPFGWGLAQYATPEQRFGNDFTSRVYAREPRESAERIRAHIRKLLPQASDAQIAHFLG